MKQEQLAYDRYDRLCAFRNGLKELVREPMEPGNRLRLYTYLYSTNKLISRIEKILSIEVTGNFNNSFLMRAKYNPFENYIMRDKIRRSINNKEYLKKYHLQTYSLRKEVLKLKVRERYQRIKSDPDKLEKLRKFQRDYYLKNQKKLQAYHLDRYHKKRALK